MRKRFTYAQRYQSVDWEAVARFFKEQRGSQSNPALREEPVAWMAAIVLSGVSAEEIAARSNPKVSYVREMLHRVSNNLRALGLDSHWPTTVYNPVHRELLLGGAK